MLELVAKITEADDRRRSSADNALENEFSLAKATAMPMLISFVPEQESVRRTR